MTEPTLTLRLPSGEETTDPAAAASAEIQEFDDQGVPTGRTYLTKTADGGIAWASTPDEETVADADTADDTGKGTWDLWQATDDGPVPVEHADQLLDVLGAGSDPDSQRAALAGMLELPAWQAAPAGLKTEVYARLDAGRQTAGPTT